MNPEGNKFLYADQEAAEKAASEYRGVIIDITEALTYMAVETDSLKLHRFAEQLQEKTRDINF